MVAVARRVCVINDLADSGLSSVCNVSESPLFGKLATATRSIIAAFHCSPVVNTSSCDRQTCVCRMSSRPMSQATQVVNEQGDGDENDPEPRPLERLPETLHGAYVPPLPVHSRFHWPERSSNSSRLPPH